MVTSLWDESVATGVAATSSNPVQLEHRLSALLSGADLVCDAEIPPKLVAQAEQVRVSNSKQAQL